MSIDNEQRGLVLVYTGNGKGKTTAALGLALWAVGHGQKVCIIQFMKGGNYGEIQLRPSICQIWCLSNQVWKPLLAVIRPKLMWIWPKKACK
jgi:ATP:corrinoid adenosyltransferase